MPDYRDLLLVSDFDRTLTDHNGRICPRNLDAIRRFLAAGGAFTVATGRSLPMYRALAQEIPVSAPPILFNGAGCYDFDREETMLLYPLPDDAIHMARDLMTRFPGLRLEIQNLDCHYVYGCDDGRDRWLEHWNVISKRIPLEQVPLPWLKLVFTGAFAPTPEFPDPFLGCPPAEDAMFRGMVDYATAAYGDRYDIARSMPRMVEFQLAGTSKGAAARALAERLGRKTLLCVGDARNDIPMLQAADRAFVPVSGDPDLLAMGFEPVCDCDDGAVADIIDRLL